MAPQITFSHFFHEVQSFTQQLLKFEAILLFTFKVTEDMSEQVLSFLLMWKKVIFLNWLNTVA